MTEQETFENVIERLPYFTEEVYIQKRLDSVPDYLPPNEFEELLSINPNKGLPGHILLTLPIQS